MAVTLTKYNSQDIHLGGDLYLWAGKITFDSSYPTNGEAIAASDFGGDEILSVSLNAAADVVTKFAYWDRANSKIKIFVEDGTSGICAEAGSTSDQSAVDVDLWVLLRNR